ncbi:MAG: hydrogenase maturation protease [Chloroflexota bacterium]|nr:hydrogenase maturation protease [Chloroflexota bacterium]
MRAADGQGAREDRARGGEPGRPRTLIAGVGYRNLRDLSAGNAVVDALLRSEWPPGVEVEDLSYGPMDAIFRLREARFARLIVVGAVARPWRLPGHVYRRRWRYEPEPPAQVQARVAEAVTGVISLDNLLVICAHFEALPPEVIVIEIEPEDDGWGEGFSVHVERAIEHVVADLRAKCGAAVAD